MGIYEKNMDCMKKHNETLYDLIKDIDIDTTSNHLEEIRSVSTRTDQLALVVKQEGVEYRLNSIYHPLHEAEKWVEQFNFNNLSNIISLYGFGNGTFVRILAEKMGEQDTLLVFEPCCEIFIHVLNNYDITDLLMNDRILLSIDNVNTFHFHSCLMGCMNIGNMRNQIMCVHPRYDVVFKDSCIWFWSEIKKVYVHTKMNINTLVYFGANLIENPLANIQCLTNSNTIEELKNFIPDNIPAIIVAAGPSVRKQIEYLKKAKGKAVIFAVDRILDYLLDEGVEPDFTATVDPGKPLKFFSRRTDITIPLLCFMESNHKIFEAHKGRKIICNASPYLNKIYFKNKIEPPNLNSGASVATMVFAACIYLGFKNIILVGQDLAYDGNLSHAGAINESDMKDRDTMIEGIDGQMIKSRMDWKEFAHWFEDIIELYPDVNVIDAKEKGAKIKGALNMPLSEALEKYCNPDAEYAINIEDLEPTFNNDIYKDLKELFQDSIKTMHNIKTRSKNAIKICNSLIKETEKDITTNKTKEYHKKLNRSLQYIKKQQVYYTFMDTYIHAISAQNVSELYEFTDDSKEDMKQTYLLSRQMFEAVLKSIEFIEPKIEEKLEFCDSKLKDDCL